MVTEVWWGNGETLVKGNRHSVIRLISSGNLMYSIVIMYCFVYLIFLRGHSISVLTTYTHTHTHIKVTSEITNEVINMLINFIVVIISLCVCISTYHIVHFKNIHFLKIFNHASRNLGEKSITEYQH